MSLSVGGIVVCGGESRRMGRPKAWLPFGRELMLQRVVRILGEVVSPIVVVAAPGQELPPLADAATVVRDEHKGKGPLQGLAGGLRRMQELGAGAAYASSTDVPFLDPRFVRRVIELLGAASIAVPFVQDRHHPLAAVYRTSVLPEIDRLLAQDRLRPVFLFERLATRAITADELAAVDAQLRSLQNVNTVEEYETALAVLGAARP